MDTERKHGCERIYQRRFALYKQVPFERLVLLGYRGNERHRDEDEKNCDV
jgi:hypothetical protein